MNVAGTCDLRCPCVIFLNCSDRQQLPHASSGDVNSIVRPSSSEEEDPEGGAPDAMVLLREGGRLSRPGLGEVLTAPPNLVGRF